MHFFYTIDHDVAKFKGTDAFSLVSGPIKWLKNTQIYTKNTWQEYKIIHLLLLIVN